MSNVNVFDSPSSTVMMSADGIHPASNLCKATGPGGPSGSTRPLMTDQLSPYVADGGGVGVWRQPRLCPISCAGTPIPFT